MLPKTFLRSPPQAPHTVSGSSLKDWTTSMCSPQDLQAYSYVGIDARPPDRLTADRLTADQHRQINFMQRALALGPRECQVYPTGEIFAPVGGTDRW